MKKPYIGVAAAVASLLAVAALTTAAALPAAAAAHDKHETHKSHQYDKKSEHHKKSKHHKKKVLKAVLTGAQEVPGPGDRNGKGAFIALANHKKLCYVLGVQKIARPTAAHIHAGRKGVAGPIVVTLRTPAKGASFGCIKAVHDDDDNPATLSKRELRAILAHPSRYYVNVHNDPFPDGAIRGQLH